MGTHNICFYGELNKLLCYLSQNIHLKDATGSSDLNFDFA